MQPEIHTVATNNEVPSCQGGIFVPVQQSAATFPPAEALMKGTAFPCLYDPYEKGENYDG